MKILRHLFCLALPVMASPSFIHAQEDIDGNNIDKLAKPPTKATIEANEKVKTELPFNNKQDYEDAKKGLLEKFDTVINSQGEIVDKASLGDAWNMKQYGFEQEKTPLEAPASVNPSLWRQAQLNNIAGLFEVIKDQVYQIRGFDLSVMTLIMGKEDGKDCWIIIDPLVTQEASKAGLSMANKKLGERPVRSVIYTHSHIDHYGGILGVASTDAINSGSIKIYAPMGFMEHAVNENVMAGTAMGRRATYMYGNLLFVKSDKSEVDAGLGKTTSSGQNINIDANTADIIPSVASIEHPEKRTICGVHIDFWYTPETEAPSEMMFYFPDLNALCASELVTHTMHNVYSLRGAAVRDALKWSGYISQVIQVYGSSIEVLFASHHWPTWGNAGINGLLAKQRDLYKYLNDQTFRLFNQGYTMIEIGERVKLPPELAQVWADRPYYGTVNHNVKALYQKSLGWFDGNPANLHALPPQEAGVKYVEYMGGSANIIDKAKKDFDKGEYRWVAMALNHLVFAEPKNMPARLLLADTYEQLGYQAESGPWRNFYLTGARELRNPDRVKALSRKGDPIPNDQSMSQMSPTDYFQYLAIHLDGFKAGSMDSIFYVVLTNDVLPMKNNVNPMYAKLHVVDGVLNSYIITKDDVDKDGGKHPVIAVNQSTMYKVMTTGGDKGVAAFLEAVKGGTASVKGGTPEEQKSWETFLGLLEKFEFWFNIVEP